MRNNFLILLCCSVGIVNSINALSERQEKPFYMDSLLTLRKNMSDTECIDRVINMINREYDDLLSRQIELKNEIKYINNNGSLNGKNQNRLIEIEAELEQLDFKKSQVMNKYSKQIAECSALYQNDNDASATIQTFEDEIDSAIPARKRESFVTNHAEKKAIEKCKKTLARAEKKAESVADKAIMATEKAAAVANNTKDKAIGKCKATLAKTKQKTETITEKAASCTKKANDVADHKKNKAIAKCKHTLKEAKRKAKKTADKENAATKKACATVDKTEKKAIEECKNALFEARKKAKQVADEGDCAIKKAMVVADNTKNKAIAKCKTTLAKASKKKIENMADAVISVTKKTAAIAESDLNRASRQRQELFRKS